MTSTSYIFMRLFCYVRKSRLTGVNDAKVRVLLAVKDFFSFLYNSNRSPINFDKHLMTWGGGGGRGRPGILFRMRVTIISSFFSVF